MRKIIIGFMAICLLQGGTLTVTAQTKNARLTKKVEMAAEKGRIKKQQELKQNAEKQAKQQAQQKQVQQKVEQNKTVTEHIEGISAGDYKQGSGKYLQKEEGFGTVKSATRPTKTSGNQKTEQKHPKSWQPVVQNKAIKHYNFTNSGNTHGGDYATYNKNVKNFKPITPKANTKKTVIPKLQMVGNTNPYGNGGIVAKNFEPTTVSQSSTETKSSDIPVRYMDSHSTNDSYRNDENQARGQLKENTNNGTSQSTTGRTTTINQSTRGRATTTSQSTTATAATNRQSTTEKRSANGQSTTRNEKASAQNTTNKTTANRQSASEKETARNQTTKNTGVVNNKGENAAKKVKEGIKIKGLKFKGGEYVNGENAHNVFMRANQSHRPQLEDIQMQSEAQAKALGKIDHNAYIKE